MQSENNRLEAGFTLLEILVVVVIIGLLMTVIGVNLLGKVGDANHKLAGMKIQQIASTLELYKLDNGRYPTSEQGLEALVREPSSDPKPRNYPSSGFYMKREQIIDPWTNEPFQYEQPGSHNRHSFDVVSLGADGVEGGEGENADLGNWDAETN